MHSVLRLLASACFLACGLMLVTTSLAAAAPPVGPPVQQGEPVPGIPYIDEVVPVVESGEWVLFVRGHFPNALGCWTVEPLDPGRYALRMFSPDSCLRDSSAATAWRWPFRLGRLMPGRYSIPLGLLVEAGPGVSNSIRYGGIFEFDVPRDTIPSPPPAKLPFVDRIAIAPADGAGGPICPEDSIRITVSGRFPNGCFAVRGIHLVRTPDPAAPPTVQVVVERGGCRGACPEVVQRWQTSIVQRPHVVGTHSQTIALVEIDCAVGDSILAHTTTEVPFTVARDCAAPPSCLLGDFVRPGGGGLCDAFVAPGDPAELTFAVLTFQDLAGLQGSFTLHPSGLRIVGIEPVGNAASMRLDWVRTTTGARFTLFAESGAPIRGCNDTPRCIPQPILRITVAADSTPARSTMLAFHDLLGSTVDGVGVPECPLRNADRIAFPGARICVSGGECDFNADGRSDIRDLVLMVHCVNDSAACPPNGAFDCNGDSASSIADVICCARHILRKNPACPTCPPDTLRPAPRVRASLGAPVHSETGVELPLSLVGAEHFGGALLELSFPADRYDATAALVESRSTGGWLDLYEVRDGKLVIGLVRLGPVMTADVDQRLELSVRLALRPGQEPGGQVACASSEFSGGDGALLAVTLGTLSQPLAGPARIQLSNARPNPSAGATTFSLTLDRPGDVDLGVFDLGGRRVATVHRGRLGAGAHVLDWNGRGDDGPVPSGVYFYRASAGGATTARKLVLLRQR